MSTQEITSSKNQYTLWQILGIWSLAAIPMGILSWIVYPAVARGFHMVVALGSVLIFLSMIPVATIRAIRNRRLGADRKPAPRGARVAGWIILGISLLNLLFLVGFALGMPAIIQNVLLDPPLITKIALGLGVLAAVLTVGALVYTVLAWKDGYWGAAFRIYYTLVTVAAVVLSGSWTTGTCWVGGTN